MANTKRPQIIFDSIHTVQIMGWRGKDGSILISGNIFPDWPEEMEFKGTILQKESVDDSYPDEDGDGVFELADYRVAGVLQIHP